MGNCGIPVGLGVSQRRHLTDNRRNVAGILRGDCGSSASAVEAPFPPPGQGVMETPGVAARLSGHPFPYVKLVNMNRAPTV